MYDSEMLVAKMGRGLMPIHYEGEDVRIVKVPGMGPINNNGYILSCCKTGDAVIIDAPAEPEKLLNAVGDSKAKAIIVTHRHPDHIAGLVEMKKNTGLPVAAHPYDAPVLPVSPDFYLADGDIYSVGDLVLEVIHTPGHTPGALCLRVRDHLFSGDTLFSGGPGYTTSHVNFMQVKKSIIEKLMPFTDETVVYPGHGENTTIGATRKEIEVFDSNPHADDLCGNVEWLS